MDNPDWSLIRSFLATARRGSLSAAAQELGLSQPSLGRHISQLEAQLGAALFQRHATGQRITELGKSLLPMAEAMELAAKAIALTAASTEETLQGTVRITASRIVAHFYLPRLIADLLVKEPRLQIEVVATDQSDNLLFHEADIALRMYRPTQPDIVTRHVTDYAMSLYASTDFLHRHGEPQTQAALLALPFVGFDRSDLILRLMAQFGIERRREDFPIRCDDQLVHWNLVRAGAGIGAIHCRIGDKDPRVQRIAPFLHLPALPLWIATAEQLSQNRRIRRVWDHLVSGLSQQENPNSLDHATELG